MLFSNVKERCSSARVAWTSIAASQIEGLAADHATCACRSGDDGNHAELPHVHSRIGSRGRGRHNSERFGQQAITRQDSHTFASNDMQRRPSTPHRVVVHCR